MPAGVVIVDRPGRRVTPIRGTNVRLVVSKGPERFRVDAALVGQPRGRTSPPRCRDLPEIQFDHRGQRTTTPWRPGSVIGFDPPAGTTLKRGQVVTSLVSKGHEPVAVPDVDRADARAGDRATCSSSASS